MFSTICLIQQQMFTNHVRETISSRSKLASFQLADQQSSFKFPEQYPLAGSLSLNYGSSYTCIVSLKMRAVLKLPFNF